ncbi:hypothetical protein [Microbulbifer aggregans]|uniref:hypothetical protein n=1 Tax=Microbulbifer aggregans TaxID=1769779 RepID=UPI001CFD9573|nr:hypothetical protein [Microbulbifer aggregans]
MTIGQKIYQAIERLSIAPKHCNEFRVSLRDSLVNEGAESQLADHLAAVAQDTLKAQGSNNYHLSMVELIAVHPEFEKLLLQDVAATSAMHKYMSFFLDLVDIQSANPQGQAL